MTSLLSTYALSRIQTRLTSGFTILDRFHKPATFLLALTASLVLLTRYPSLIAAAYLNAASVDMSLAVQGNPYASSGEASRAIRAVRSLERAEAWDPHGPSLYRTLARALLIAGDYDGAIEVLSNSLEPAGGPALAWFDLGNAFEGQGDRRKAIAAWKMAGAAPYFQERGWFLYDSVQDYPAALNSYQIATQIDPQDWESWLMASRAFGQLGNWDEALRALSMVLDAGEAPDEEIRFNALMSLGTWHSYHLQDIEQAEAWLARAIELRPQDVTPYLEAGYAYEMAGMRKEAQQWYRRAEAADPTSENPNLYLGRSLFQAHDDSNALRELVLATAKNPENQEPYFYLGLIYQRQGDLLEAEKLLRRAIALIPSQAPSQAFAIPYHHHLARVLAAAGKLEDAIAEYQVLLSHDPADEVAARELASLLRALGK